jgi:hypothetical protein
MAQGTAVESSVPVDDAHLADAPAEDAADIDAAEPADPPDPAIEARAREMGWKPLAEYRGPLGKWQPAAEFIARGENILPIVRDQNRRLTEKVSRFEGEFASMRRSLDEQSQIIKDLREMGRKADQRGYDRAMAEIKAQQRQAVERGDTASYDQLVAQAEALASERPMATTASTVEPPAPRQPAQPAVTEPVRTFIASNPWFNTDPILNAAMTAHHGVILRERQVTQDVLNANLELDRELLEEAKQRVMDAYPDRFGAPVREPAPRPAAPRRRAAAVTPPTAEPSAPRRDAMALTINSIADPAERAQAREAFNRMKRSMPDYTEAEYMALYDDPHSDVLSMQQQKPRTQANGR